MSAKAELEWVEVERGHGDVYHIGSGRLMGSCMTLTEACGHFETVIRVKFPHDDDSGTLLVNVEASA